jgi:hypothetical protein
MRKKILSSKKTQPNDIELKARENRIDMMTKKSLSTDQNFLNFSKIKEQTQIKINKKEEENFINKWKDDVLSKYLIQPNQVHSVINKINTDKAKGHDFYFLQGAEIHQDRQDSIILFGKIKSGNQFIESKILIKNPKRTIYVFPKRDEKFEDVETEIREKLGKDAKNLKFSKVKKKYCFEINIEYR